MKLTILGSGTSSGVPTISCKCPTCLSPDSRDKRLRASVLIQSDTTTVLIDSGPDFRRQMLNHKIDKLDAVVYTHYHFDHIGGFDDLRALNFTSGKAVPIYLTDLTFMKLKQTFFYSFEEPEQLGGGVPMIDAFLIDLEEFSIGEITLKPIPLKHGILDVLGFRIANLAYCTDCSEIPAESYPLLENLDVLILDALRYQQHPTHFSISEALSEVGKLKPKMTFLTHIAHQIKHEEAESKLPENVRIAYDDLIIDF